MLPVMDHVQLSSPGTLPAYCEWHRCVCARWFLPDWHVCLTTVSTLQ